MSEPRTPVLIDFYNMPLTNEQSMLKTQEAMLMALMRIEDLLADLLAEYRTPKDSQAPAAPAPAPAKKGFGRK